MSRTSVSLSRLAIAAILALCGVSAYAADRTDVERAVTAAVRPVMAKYQIPGMAVAVVAGGRRYVLNYGVASKESGKNVTDDTIFEIGSLSKTLTATLAAYAQERGALSFSDMASKHARELAGSSFDAISLLDLGTYVAGGLPLQFPDGVVDRETMIAFYKGWRPSYPAGTRRLYSNPSVGLFGYLAAKAMGAPFDALMEKTLFPALGMTRTFIRVPPDRMGDYAFGYRDGEPIRVTPGVLDAEAYGVKTTAGDMIRFVEANMDGSGLDEPLRRAIDATHLGRYKVGSLTQGLGWEIYADAADLDGLLAGNAPDVILEPNLATRLDPPSRPGATAVFNKTGSTNGFGAYVAFVPGKIGIVMLANKNYPIPARVGAAHQILSALSGG